MVTLLKRLMILCSLILTVGSAWSMLPGKNGKGSVSLLDIPMEQLERAVQVKKQQEAQRALSAQVAFQEEQDDEQDDEQEETTIGTTISVARAITVALLSGWRIQHYAAQICQITGNGALLGGWKFNAGCLVAAGAVTLMDYCMPKTVGSCLTGIFAMDALNAWMGSKTAVKIAAPLISPRLATPLP